MTFADKGCPDRAWPISVCTAILFGILTSIATASSAPVGVYLWYAGQDGRPSDADCKAFVDAVRPSVGKAEDFVWGRVPATADPEFYLFVTASRIDSTYSAEGDYDHGRVVFGATIDGGTSFTLIPDDHPDTAINGDIFAPGDSQVVTLTLRDIPNETQSQRVTYFCRFVDGADI